MPGFHPYPKESKAQFSKRSAKKGSARKAANAAAKKKSGGNPFAKAYGK